MDIQPHLQTIGTTSTGMKPTLHKKPSKTLGRAESRSMYKMPTSYILGRERGGSMTMKPTATRTWPACPGSTRGEEGVPFGEQAPRPTWHWLCVQPQLHTLGSATPLSQTFQNPLQQSVTACASAVCTCFLRPSLTSGEDEASSLQLLAGGQVWGHRAARAVPVFFLLPKEYKWLSLACA